MTDKIIKGAKGADFKVEFFPIILFNKLKKMKKIPLKRQLKKYILMISIYPTRKPKEAISLISPKPIYSFFCIKSPKHNSRKNGNAPTKRPAN